MKDCDKTKEQLLDEIVTLRQRVAALEAGERRFRTVIDMVPLAIGEINRDGVVVFANATTEKMFGYAPQEIVGTSTWDRIELGPAREAFRAWFHRTMSEQLPPSPVFGSRIKKSGQRIDIRGDWDYVRNEKGEVTGLVTVVADVTESQQTERELARHRVMLQATIDCLPFNFFAIGLDGRYMLQNAVSKAQQRADVVGRRPEEVCPNAHDLAIWADNNRRALAGEKVEGEVTLSLGGTERFYYNVIAPISDGTELYGILGVNIDITERKRAEAALQKAHDELEEKVKERTAELTKANEELAIFRKFAEASGQGFSMAGLDGRLLYLNPTLCRMLGDDHPEDRVGQPLSVCYPEQSNRRGKEEIEPALKRQGYWQGELPMLSRQGKLIPTWQDSFLIRDDSGAPFRLAVVITDITQRKAAEEALRQSERRFRNYFEQGLIGMAVTSVDKRWLEVNDRLCEILGHSAEELRQKTWIELTHPDDVEPNLRLFQPLLAGEIEHFTLDKRYLKKDGSIVHATIHTRAFRKEDGMVDHIITLIEDVTARKQAEEAVRESEEKYQGVAEACPDAIVMSDWSGRVLFASRQTRGLLGLADADELVGRSVFDFVIDSDRPRLAENMSDLLRAGVRRSTEYTGLRHDGTTVPTEVSSTVIRDAAGQPKAVMAVIRDITTRKKAQEALERERQSLWRMLQAGDHERQTISYEIHDGLAQYLAAATMQFQSHDALRENSPEKAKKAYETAVQLVRQSHAEARRLVSEVRPPIIDEIGLETGISHLVHEQRRHGGPQIQCHSDVQFGRLPAILENALYRIVQEALTNACKHSKSKKVEVTMTQEGQDVHLAVRDWGIGFDLESVEKGHFGLEGIRQRVRLLGGRLTIESTPGSGTLVQVVMPIVAQESKG
jgi:PAS domain S-box-containing protein